VNLSALNVKKEGMRLMLPEKLTAIIVSWVVVNSKKVQLHVLIVHQERMLHLMHLQRARIVCLVYIKTNQVVLIVYIAVMGRTRKELDQYHVLSVHRVRMQLLVVP